MKENKYLQFLLWLPYYFIVSGVLYFNQDLFIDKIFDIYPVLQNLKLTITAFFIFVIFGTPFMSVFFDKDPDSYIVSPVVAYVVLLSGWGFSYLVISHLETYNQSSFIVIMLISFNNLNVLVNMASKKISFLIKQK